MSESGSSYRERKSVASGSPRIKIEKSRTLDTNNNSPAFKSQLNISSKLQSTSAMKSLLESSKTKAASIKQKPSSFMKYLNEDIYLRNYLNPSEYNQLMSISSLNKLLTRENSSSSMSSYQFKKINFASSLDYHMEAIHNNTAGLNLTALLKERKDLNCSMMTESVDISTVIEGLGGLFSKGLDFGKYGSGTNLDSNTNQILGLDSNDGENRILTNGMPQSIADYTNKFIINKGEYKSRIKQHNLNVTAKKEMMNKLEENQAQIRIEENSNNEQKGSKANSPGRSSSIIRMRKIERKNQTKTNEEVNNQHINTSNRSQDVNIMNQSSLSSNNSPNQKQDQSIPVPPPPPSENKPTIKKTKRPSTSSNKRNSKANIKVSPWMHNNKDNIIMEHMNESKSFVKEFSSSIFKNNMKKERRATLHSSAALMRTSSPNMMQSSNDMNDSKEKEREVKRGSNIIIRHSKNASMTKDQIDRSGSITKQKVSVVSNNQNGSTMNGTRSRKYNQFQVNYTSSVGSKQKPYCMFSGYNKINIRDRSRGEGGGKVGKKAGEDNMMNEVEYSNIQIGQDNNRRKDRYSSSYINTSYNI